MNSGSSISNSFWNIETSGQTSSAGGTEKTIEEMQYIATYTDTTTVGLDFPWDFVGNPFNDIANEDYWNIETTINDGYPYLSTLTVSSENETIVELTNLSELIGNYPNPFNPTTTIEFSVESDSNIELIIYNIKGQKIKTATQKQYEKGIHSIIWDGDDKFGKSVSSGIYLYELNVNGKTEAVKKCLLLK